jgi:SAM-dependent methyltransferase
VRASPSDTPEITDLIIAYDYETRERLPVRKAEVVERFLALGRADAAKLVAALPEEDGHFVNEAIDALMVRVHTELQRLHEEFHNGERIATVLKPLCETLRGHGRLRIADVGCGTGFAVRWLSMHGELGDDVALVGCDYNAALIAAAREVARQEGLRCRFEVENAFRLRERASIYLSMGVVHHFRGEELDDFFRAQLHDDTLAFVHFDIAPSWLTPLGAWIFHIARMREPIARHDGVLSALRAHPDEVLLASARRVATDFAVGLYATPRGLLPITRTIRPIIGVRRAHAAALRERLGPLLEGFP